MDKDIVSGPIDVDMFDYLLRDSYFAGVKYGTYDLDKVIESLSPVDISRNDQQLGIREEGIYSIEQLLLAKYHMNVQVYQHRLRRITDAMLVRGIEFALNEGLVRGYQFISAFERRRVLDTPELNSKLAHNEFYLLQ